MTTHRWDPRAQPPRGLVVPVRRDLAGISGPTAREVSARYWRRVAQGWYVPADVDNSLPEQRIVEASVRLPDDGAITGWAGCRMHGANFFDGLAPDGITQLPVELAVGAHRGLRPQVGIIASSHRFAADDRCWRYGVPVLGVERCLVDTVRHLGSLAEAVAAVDMVCAAELTSLRRIAAYAEGKRLPPLFRRALPLASEWSRSPLESRARVQLGEDVCLLGLLVNAPVTDLTGRLLGIVDLLDEAAGLAIELDGRDHRALRRHRRDLAKDEALRSVGIEVTRLTGADLRDRQLAKERVLGARQRARFLQAEERQWIVGDPGPCLDARLAEREFWQQVHERGVRSATRD